jgi:hypothetical protein
MRRFVFATALSMLITGASRAATINYSGGTYTEGFDSRADGTAANGTLAWSETAGSETVPGWFAWQPGGGTTLTTAGTPSSIALANGLSSGSVVVNFYRSTVSNSTDISLGSQNFNGNSTAGNASTTGGIIHFGFGLVNTSGQTLTSFTLAYNAELWSTNNTATAVDGLNVSYATGATGVADSQGSWTSTSLGVSVPIATTTSSITGFASPSGTVSGISWLPGETLFVRWSDENVAGNDRGMAIDNVSFSAVPEPGVAGLTCVAGLLALRRRSRGAKR